MVVQCGGGQVATKTAQQSELKEWPKVMSLQYCTFASFDKKVQLVLVWYIQHIYLANRTTFESL
jgi:hypothetical protein